MTTYTSPPRYGLLGPSSVPSRARISIARPSARTRARTACRASGQGTLSAAAVRLIGPRGRGVIGGARRGAAARAGGSRASYQALQALARRALRLVTGAVQME